MMSLAARLVRRGGSWHCSTLARASAWHFGVPVAKWRCAMISSVPDVDLSCNGCFHRFASITAGLRQLGGCGLPKHDKVEERNRTKGRPLSVCILNTLNHVQPLSHWQIEIGSTVHFEHLSLHMKETRSGGILCGLAISPKPRNVERSTTRETGTSTSCPYIFKIDLLGTFR